MLNIESFPLRSPSPGSAVASHTNRKAFAPSIVWRSKAPVAGLRLGKPAPLRLVTAVDGERHLRLRVHRARTRARVCEGAYVAAALGTALAIFWSAR